MEEPAFVVLRRIRVHPLKGAGGFDLDETTLDAFGVPGDRRWMLASPNGRFFSQRTHPRIALLRTFPTEEGPSPSAGSPSCPSFKVEAPGKAPITLSPSDTGEWMQVQVHDDRFKALMGFEDADRWFSQFLSEACRLVFLPDGIIRPVDPAWAPGHRVSLADGYPLHLATEESLVDLNAHLDEPTSMLRYRPNLVVAGGAPWEEDEWRALDIGGTRVELVKPCARCTVVTVDPESAKRGNEPLRTMRRFREWEGKVYFGQNAVVKGSGRFRVGMDVHILERGDRRPPIGSEP
jgi:uncharacterized protein YcbX